MSDFAQARVEQTGPNSYAVSHGNDQGLYVEFTNEPVLMEAESEKAGGKIYKDIAHIRILTPGGKSEVFRRVRLTDEEAQPAPPDPIRFPRQWAAFKAQNSQENVGVPLAMWAALSKSQVLEYKARGVHTVEQLSNISDATLQSFGMDGRKWRDMAKAFLDKAEESRQLSSALADKVEMQSQIDAQAAQIADLGRMCKELSEGKPKGSHYIGTEKGKA